MQTGKIICYDRTDGGVCGLLAADAGESPSS